MGKNLEGLLAIRISLFKFQMIGQMQQILQMELERDPPSNVGRYSPQRWIKFWTKFKWPPK